MLIQIHLSILAAVPNKLFHAGDRLDRWLPAVDSLGTKIKMKHGHLLESITFCLVDHFCGVCLKGKPLHLFLCVGLELLKGSFSGITAIYKACGHPE